MPRGNREHRIGSGAQGLVHTPRLVSNISHATRAFPDGTGPAVTGARPGSAIPLARAVADGGNTRPRSRRRPGAGLPPRRA
jgi:hypothetical protein